MQTDVADVVARVRHWLDLDLDPASQVTRFGDDSTLGPLVRERPGLRRIRYPESFEAAISTVLGQQVSLAAARTFAGRLVAAYGAPGPGGLTAFPAPERVAAADLEELRAPSGSPVHAPGRVLAVAELFAGTGGWPVPLPPESVGRASRRACWPCRASDRGPSPICGCACSVTPTRCRSGIWCCAGLSAVAKDREVPAAMGRWRPERSYAVFQLWASTAW